METIATVALFAAAQIGALIWTVATLRAHLKNLTGWLKAVSAKGEETHDAVISIQATIAHLPCERCSYQTGD